jgi:hypothetical protein
MRIPIDIHWMPRHQGREDYDAFTAIQPEAIWIVNPDANLVNLAHTAAPSALMGLRDHAQSEQKDFMLRDPEGCAAAHVRDWREHVRSWAGGLPRGQVFVTGINEPDLDPGHAGAVEAAVRYNVALLDGLTAEGIALGALGASVGWPANDGDRRPVCWDQYRPVLEAIRRGRQAGVLHFLNLHEYWGKAGPQAGWGWYAGRYLWLAEWLQAWGWNPADVPIRFGEFGLDSYATDPAVSDPHGRGWQSWLSQEAYITHIEWYLNQLAWSPTVLGAAGFTWDYQSSEWWGYDWRALRNRAIDLVRRLRAQSGPSVARQGLPSDVIPVSAVIGPATPPPATTGEPLPEDETATDPTEQARKLLWWCQEDERAFEADQVDRAHDIVRSLIVLAERHVSTLSPVAVPAYSQRDLRWAGLQLGTGPSTIGQAGCLIVAVAAGLRGFGVDTDPARLNAWLIEHGGYSQGDLFIWQSIEPFGVHLQSYVACPLTAAPMAQIRQALASGYLVIAEVDAQPGASIQQHWVRLLSVTADGRDAEIMDPWQLPGAELCRLAEHYLAQGWDVARAVMAVGIYRKA